MDNSNDNRDEQMREQAREINSDVNRWKEDCRQAHELYDLMIWAN